MTAKDIEQHLENHFHKEKYTLNNAYFFHYLYKETDFLVIRPSGYMMDVEIKISKSDFKADAKKVSKHQILKGKKVKRGKKELTVTDYPNYFYYAYPKGMLEIKDVPAHAGIIEVDENGYCEITKKAPTLHKRKLDYHEKLCNKLYYGYKEGKRLKGDNPCLTIQKELRDAKKRLSDLQRECNNYKSSYLGLLSEKRKARRN